MGKLQVNAAGSNGGLLPQIFLRFGMLGFAQVAGSALSFLTALLITRIGGAAMFGQYALAVSVLTYATVVTMFGTNISGVRETAAHPEQLETLFPAIMLVRLIFGTVSFLAILILAPIFAPDPDARLIYFIICTGIFAVVFYPTWIPQGLESVKVAALTIFGPFALTFLFSVIAVFVRPEGWAFAISKLAADVLMATGLMIWAWKYFAMPSPAQVWQQAIIFVRKSAAVTGSQLVRGLAFVSDIVIVSFFFSDSTLGHYSAAQRIYLLIVSVSMMYYVILFPRLSKMAQQGIEVMKCEMRRSLCWTIPLAMAGAIFFILVIPYLFPLVFGSGFADAVPAMQLLGVAGGLNFVHKTYSQGLLAVGRTGQEFAATGLATVIGVAFKLIGTAFWGITGTAMGVLAGEVVLLAMLFFYSRQMTPASSCE